MISFNGVNKKYGDKYVINNINLELPRSGLVIINGPSGCGKTTLLNILSTLLDFDGEIVFEGKKYSLMNENDKEEIRSQKIGFIFQDYKLFEFESVKENILLTLDIACGDKKVKKYKRIKDLLRIVNLTNKENELVSNLSGGEKQRVAIARAIANSPKVILADEPTGNLDEYNSKNVMEILQRISAYSLVVMVSHDFSLTKEYADEIIKMNDGEIVDIKYQNKKKHQQFLPLLNLSYWTKSRLLPFGFLLKHTISSIKRRKWRTAFITMVTSLGLIGVGLASTLSSIISTNLNRSYSSILDDDRLILSSKNSETKRDFITSMNYEDVSNLYEAYKDSVDYIGVYYANNFEQMFTVNDVTITSSGSKKPINGLSIKYINEFANLKSSINILPNKINNLSNNEFVLSAPFSIVNEICYQLEIERTLESFSNYLDRSELYFTFALENSYWSYLSDFSLKLSGFILSNKILFYHSNPIWNEYIFETKLALPTTNKLNANSEHPWDLKKGYYLSFNKNRDKFIEDHRFNFDYSNADFEILDSKYYPNLLSDVDLISCNKVLCVNRTNKDLIPSFLGEYCKKTSNKIKNIIYGSSSAYAIYDRNLMVGFAKNAYLTSLETNIEDIIDLQSYIKYENSQKMEMPKGTVQGHFTLSNTQGFVFEPHYKLIDGRKPINYQEIVISNSLCKKLNLDSPINKNIYFTYPVIENLLPNGYISRDFKVASIKIVGISNSAKLALHHHEAWSILFFQTMLGMSSFELNVENLAIQINKNYEDSIIKKLSRAFPEYEVYSPLKDVRENVDKICHYIELILLIVSIASIIIASFILFICNYLHFIEAKKDIGLVRCLGIKQKESKKFVFAHSILMSLLSLIFSSIELFVISYVLAKSMANRLQINEIFILNPLSFVYMIAVDLFIGLVSSILISSKISNLKPLDCLR